MTLTMLYEHFYWSGMRRDVHKLSARCIVCKRTKSKVMPHGLDIPYLFPFPLGFCARFALIKNRKRLHLCGSGQVLSKMAHFIPRHKSMMHPCGGLFFPEK